MSHADLAAIIEEGEKLLAAMDRDAKGFPAPLPWYVSGDRNMVWADDGDCLLSYAHGSEPSFERPVAALIVFAANNLPLLLRLARAGAEMREAYRAHEALLDENEDAPAETRRDAALRACDAEDAWDAAVDAAREGKP